MKFLKPVESLFHFLVNTKNYLYQLQLLRALKLQVPIVSIGNLSFGGTGKTPCVIFLADELSLKYKTNVVTKSYKASLIEAKEVDLNLKNAAALFGDEACLIRSKLKNCSVWSGPDKSKTALLSMTNQPQLILLDDGFSHLKLYRNFDLVLVDASIGFDSYLRESIRSLKRAHAILITKINLSTPEKLTQLIKTIETIAPHLRQNIFRASILTNLNVEKSNPLFIFCGLARPETFIQDLNQQGFVIEKTKLYPDHFVYSEDEQKRMFLEFIEVQKKHENIKLVTTEKDYTKITDLNLKKIICIAEHRMEMESQQKGDLLEKIRKSF